MMQQPPITESFSDFVEVQINSWSAAITFGLRAVRQGDPNTPLRRERMSLEQAKILALLLLRTVRTYESVAGMTIEMPDRILGELGIPVEDWRRLA